MTTTASNRLCGKCSASRDGRTERCYVDLGYRGHDVDDIQLFKARRKGGVTKRIRRELKRRNALVYCGDGIHGSVDQPFRAIRAAKG